MTDSKPVDEGALPSYPAILEVTSKEVIMSIGISGFDEMDKAWLDEYRKPDESYEECWSRLMRNQRMRDIEREEDLGG